MKEIEVVGDANDVVVVGRFEDSTKIELFERSGDRGRWWHGDRVQTRALIEALRKVDAETRTEPEVILRRENGMATHYVIYPGSVIEIQIGGPYPSLPNAELAKTCFRESHDGSRLANATIYASGFDEENT